MNIDKQLNEMLLVQSENIKKWEEFREKSKDENVLDNDAFWADYQDAIDNVKAQSKKICEYNSTL